MFIAKVENGVVVQAGEHKELFPGFSFPVTGPSESFMSENNCMNVNAWKPHDKLIQKLNHVAPYVENGEVFVVEVVTLTEEEINQDKAAAMAGLKKQRNDLLTVCDWTQAADCPVAKQPWIDYRQLLRDFPGTITDPRVAFEFPKSPDWVSMSV